MYSVHGKVKRGGEDWWIGWDGWGLLWETRQLMDVLCNTQTGGKARTSNTSTGDPVTRFVSLNNIVFLGSGGTSAAVFSDHFEVFKVDQHAGGVRSKALPGLLGTWWRG